MADPLSDPREAAPQKPPAPAVTDGMRKEAQQQPGGYVYVVDPAYGPDDAVPGHAVLGAYAVDSTGQIIPNFIYNARYRSSASAKKTPPA